MTDLKDIRLQTKYDILLIGDSCTDEYKIGTVDRISPEAPVPIIKITEEYSLPGMAGNVKRNIEQLGILECDFITNNIDIKKTRYIDRKSGQHILRVDAEPEIPSWSGRIWFNYNDFDAIIISDYNKGFLTYENIENIISQTNIPIFIDTKKRNLNRFCGENVFVKINEQEYKNSNSIPTNLIVTLGERGAWFKNSSNTKLIPTTPVEVVDVCGCGDTFLAALTYQYLCTNDIEESIMFANTAAGITVQHRGNYAPTFDEIKNARY